MDYGQKGAPNGLLGLNGAGVITSPALLGTGINATQIGNGDVTNTQLSYSNSLTANIQTQINALIAGKSFRGGYDASINLFPSTGGSGTAGAIQAGDQWEVTVDGTLGGTPVDVGTVITALVNLPGQTAGNWSINANGVFSIFGRQGVVTAQTNDYTIAQITNGLSNLLTNGNIFVGNISGIATGVSPSGEISMTNTGVFTLSNSAVIGKLITGFSATNSAIVATDTVLQGFNKSQGQISSILTQLSLKAPLANPSFTGGATITGGTFTITDGLHPSLIVDSTFGYITIPDPCRLIVNLIKCQSGFSYVEVADKLAVDNDFWVNVGGVDTVLLAVNATKAVTTFNNTLDDGSGNMSAAATKTLSVDNIIGKSTDLVLNPSASGQFVRMAYALTSANVSVGENSLNTIFKVMNIGSATPGFQVSNFAVTTLHNSLEDGSGNMSATGTITAPTVSANNISGISGNIGINPAASGQVVSLGHNLASAIVKVGVGSTSTDFEVRNSLGTFFTAIDRQVYTYNNSLDDGVNGNMSAAGSITANGDMNAGFNGGSGHFSSYPGSINSGVFNFQAANNSGNYVITLSNASHGQATTYSIPDVGAATGQILNKTAAFVSGNLIAASGTAGKTVDGGVAANVVLTSAITTPDVGSNLIAVNITIGQAALASGGSVTVQASSGSKQYKILSLQLNSGGTNFSGGGGNRLGQVTDGTTVYTVIPAANMQALTNAQWGSTALPNPASAAINTSTVAGTNLVFKYSGGTTDYTAGSLTLTALLQRVA